MLDSATELREFLHRFFDKPERIPALHVLHARITDHAVFWEVLGRLWVLSESLYRDEPYIRAMLTPERLASPDRRHMMEPDDEVVLNLMPDPIPVYRGCWAGNAAGWSYTVDREKAKWFANRCAMDGQPLLLEGSVAKADVLAYLYSRGESELVIPPERVTIARRVRLPPRQPTTVDLLAQQVQALSVTSDPTMRRIIRHINAMNNVRRMGIDEYLRQCDAQIAIFDRYGFTEKAEEFRQMRDEGVEFSKTSAESEDQDCTGCIHLRQVVAHRYGTSSSGPGCGRTGGHAVKRCAAYSDAI